MRADPENTTALDLLRQMGESCHADQEVREILAAHLKSGAPDYPVKLYLAEPKKKISETDAATRLYKELRQAGHSDSEITEGLMRTDPDSAYASSDSFFDEDIALHSPNQLPPPSDWEPPLTIRDQVRGLFGALDGEDIQPALDGEADFFL